MQTTLLGLAIAIILALVTALVGPLLINWGGYRSLFEAEASHLIGLHVRVRGAIDARLLPSPQLTLHDIAIGNADADNIRARALEIEFALGSLLRGEWRASNLHLAGPRLRLSLDRAGRLKTPKLVIGFKPDALSIEHLSVTDGKLTLADAANDAKITLDKLYFNGEATSLIGPISGEGDVVVDGEHYPYRLAAGRYRNDGTLKLHVDVDPRSYPLSIKADGTLKLADAKPRFDGRLTLARPASLAKASGGQLNEPWRLHAKLKITAASARMDEAEFNYGSQQQGFKLTGLADFAYGKRPSFRAKLSGGQVNLGRVLNDQNGGRVLPSAAVRKLAGLAAQAFRPTIPIQISVGIDELALGGGAVQNMHGDISADASGWNLDRLAFRAPGFTQAKVSGHLTVEDKDVTFTGPVEIESTDPKALAAWLEGRRPPAKSDLQPLQLQGTIIVGGRKIAIERVKAEFAHKAITGRFVYLAPTRGHPSKLDALLNAPELDLDAALDFGKTLLTGSYFALPHDMSLRADVGKATIAGIAARKLSAKVKVDAGRWRIDRFTVADLGGASFSARGNLSLAGPSSQSKLRVDFKAQDMTPVIALLARFAPNAAQALKSRGGAMAPAKLHAQLSLGGRPPSQAKIRINGSLGKVRVALTGEGQVSRKPFRIGRILLDGKLQAGDGKALVSMLGLDPVVAVGAGPGMLTFTANGPAYGQWQVDGRLTADGLDARTSGTASPLAVRPSATLRATVARANAAPLRGSGATLPVTFAGAIALAGDDLTLSDIDATIADANLKGKLALSLTQPHRLHGEIEANTIDGPTVIGTAIGMPPPASVGREVAWAWSQKPFGKGLFGNVSGRVAIKAQHLNLLPGVTGLQFGATLRLGRNELALDDITGVVSGGQFAGAMSFHAGEDGLVGHAKIALTGADAAALLPHAGRAPVTGSLDLSADLDGSGLSPVALVGALHGSGKIVLRNAAFAGLDPRTFDTVTQAVDKGLAVHSAHIPDLVRKALDGGKLAVSHAQGTIAIDAGQARLVGVTAESKAAELSLDGNFDLIDGTLDAHLTLSGPQTAGTARPDIFVALTGPVTAPTRSIDVSALTAWLTLRAVDNQAKRLRAIEEAAPQSNSPSAAPMSEPVPQPSADQTVAPSGDLTPAVTGGPDAARKMPSVPEANRFSPLEPPPALMPSAPNSDRAPSLPPPIEIGPLPGSELPQTSVGPQN